MDVNVAILLSLGSFSSVYKEWTLFFGMGYFLRYRTGFFMF